MKSSPPYRQGGPGSAPATGCASTWEATILQVVRNVPGLQNAGAMWAEKITGFLLDFGFTQSITERRLFHLTDEDGLVYIFGTVVDDFKVVVQLESKAWEKR